MEHQRTRNQRLQTYGRLQRLQSSARPERERRLFTFEDHHRAVERIKVYEEERKRAKKEMEVAAMAAEKLRLKRLREVAAIKAEIEAAATEKMNKDILEQSESREDIGVKGCGVEDVNANADVDADADADDEDDRHQHVSIEPRTPDRPTGRRKRLFGSEPRSRGGNTSTKRLHGSYESPSTAGKTAGTESEDGASSGKSCSTAATTPEDGDYQPRAWPITMSKPKLKPRSKPVIGSSSNGTSIFETPTKASRERTKQPKFIENVRERICTNTDTLTKPYVHLPTPKRGDIATVRAADEPIQDWYFLLRACLQCEIAGVECGKQIPACRQCQRRFDGNFRNYRMANSRSGPSGGSSGGSSSISSRGSVYGTGDWSRPDGMCVNGGRDAASQCLVQRMWHCEELKEVCELPDQREAILIRLESDGDEVWRGKLREAARLLDVYRTQRERRNWALPSQVARIRGYPAPKTVTENDGRLKERLVAAKNRKPAIDDVFNESCELGLDGGSMKNAGRPSAAEMKSLNRHLWKMRMNERYNDVDYRRGRGRIGSESGSESDVQPWWEEHLTQEEQEEKRRRRRVERCRWRRIERGLRWERGRGSGSGSRREGSGDDGDDGDDSEDANVGSDWSVDSFVVASVHLGLSA